MKLDKIFKNQVKLWPAVATAVAASLAYALGIALGVENPMFAAVAALLTVQMNPSSAAKEAWALLWTTIVSLLFAVVFIHLWDNTTVVIFTTVLVGLILSKILNLSESLERQVPLYALFFAVLGTNLTTDFSINRLAAIVIGGVIGLILSVFSHPRSPQKAALAALQDTKDHLAKMLYTLPKASRQDITKQWASMVKEHKTLLKECEVLVKRYTDLYTLRHPVLTHKTETTMEVLLQRSISDFETVLSMADTLFNSTHTSMKPVIPQVLESAAELLVAPTDDHEQALDTVRDCSRDVVSTSRKMEDTGIWISSGAFLADVKTLTEDRLIERPLELAEPKAHANKKSTEEVPEWVKPYLRP